MCFLVVQEAVATGDPELLQLVLERRDFQRYSSRVGGIPELLQKLKEVSTESCIWTHSPPKGMSILTVHIDRNNMITLEGFTILFHNKMNLVTSFKYNSLTLLLIHYWILFLFALCLMSHLGSYIVAALIRILLTFVRCKGRETEPKTCCVSLCLKLSVFSVWNKRFIPSKLGKILLYTRCLVNLFWFRASL